MLELYYSSNTVEAGIDEVGRGCLAGPVYAAAVILPKDIDDSPEYEIIKDSKKLSAKKRESLTTFIKEKALAYGIGIVDSTEIDEINILQASYKAMHRALDKLSIIPDHIIVDGNRFVPYLSNEGDFVAHQCVPGGDNIYMSIAAASIIAKYHRDEYMINLAKNKDFEKYAWEKNKGYGTKEHRDAIVKFGISKFHRTTFGICKRY